MKEADIRPAELLQGYIDLCAQDAVTYFTSPRADVPCPACGAEDGQPAFEKNGFGYLLCDLCGTLYQSPRPPQEDFFHFYQESPSSRYWFQVFFPTVAEARRVNIFRPKVDEIARLCRENELTPRLWTDIGAGYGLLQEEGRAAFPETRMVAIEPNPDLAAQCRGRNLEVLECFAEEADALTGQADLVTALEVVEHIHDPLVFVIALKRLLAPAGRLLITGPTADGFDIQMLWQKSKTVLPPHHINLISVRGFEILLSRAGFTRISVFTPGKLDVDIVLNALAQGETLSPGQRFIQTLLARGETTRAAFQKFLQEQRLSSHCWAWAVKEAEPQA